MSPIPDRPGRGGHRRFLGRDTRLRHQPGPRLVTLVAGFRNTGFGTPALWVPIVGPLAGGLLGALVYDLLIRPFLPAQPAESP